jgi:deazaflavin-dependent oxidoreductase (nitroreductase family)
MTAHYKAPGWFTRNVFNRFVAFLTRCGISVWGSRTLMVKGRTSGEARTTPVNVLTFEDTRYLVAPRGETQWVRNLRAANGNGVLLLGKKASPFFATEVADAEKPPILRAYLKRWKAEVGVFFDGVSAKSPESELERIAPKHPVFRLEP